MNDRNSKKNNQNIDKLICYLYKKLKKMKVYKGHFFDDKIFFFFVEFVL